MDRGVRQTRKGAETSEVTKVTELEDGFRVVLVSYTKVHIERSSRRRCTWGGMVLSKREKPERLLKNWGEAYTSDAVAWSSR